MATLILQKKKYKSITKVLQKQQARSLVYFTVIKL